MRVHAYDDCSVRLDDGRGTIIAQCSDMRDARRLQAIWNLMVGIDVEQIEAMAIERGNPKLRLVR